MARNAISGKGKRNLTVKKRFIILSAVSIILLIGISVALWFTSSLPLKLYNYEGCTAELYDKFKPYRQLTEQETARLVEIIESAELSLFGFVDDTMYVGGPVEYVIHLKSGIEVTIDVNSPYLIYNGRSFTCDENTLRAMYDEFYQVSYQTNNPS